jgi:hypothetical protein
MSSEIAYWYFVPLLLLFISVIGSTTPPEIQLSIMSPILEQAVIPGQSLLDNLPIIENPNLIQEMQGR